MKNTTIALIAASLLTSATALPSYADSIGHDAAGLVGSLTAFVVDVPEGLVYDSLHTVPRKFRKGLAASFGDEGGWKQNIAGAALGWPTGIVIGVPYGAIRGGQHAFRSGFDKPFSMESFNVIEEK